MFVIPGNQEIEFLMELARQQFLVGVLLIIVAALIISILKAIHRGEL